jgi:DNA invertase Pin-like site-specific DNA recombinase
MAISKQKSNRAIRVRASEPDGKGRRTSESMPSEGNPPAKSSPLETELSLRAALEYLREGDVFVVHSIDRLTQNIEDLRKVVLALSGRGILVEFIKELLATTTEDNAKSRLLIKAIGAVAEFHHALMKEHRGESLKATEKTAGRKGRKPSLTPERVVELRKRAAAGEKKAALAREFGISRETLYQYLAVL